MKENINYKILYRILRQYSYNRNMEAMNILYKELVLEGVIPEFKFNMEVWKNDKSGINIPDSLCKDCMVIPKAYISETIVLDAQFGPLNH